MSNANISTSPIPRVTKQQRQERDKKIVSMYQSGKSGTEIGAEFKITRSNVNRIIKSHGIKFCDVSEVRYIKTEKAKRVAACEDRSMKIYGFCRDTVKGFREKGLTESFKNQRNSAKARGINWNLSFYEWFTIWIESGNIDLRGRGLGKYCMSRIGDLGDYSVGNVFIQLSANNSRDAAEKWKGKKKENRGVFLLYPGRNKSWDARYLGVSIGFFATELEAVTERNLHIEKNSLQIQ